MRISPSNRLDVQGDLFDTREASRLMYVVIPVLVQENFDQDTRSADDMTDGDGLGEIVGKWRIYAIRGHYRNVDTMLMTYGHVPPGVELGDFLLNFGPRDLDAFNQALTNENSYLLIDGQTFKLISILPSGLGQNEDWSADARKTSPIFRATGY